MTDPILLHSAYRNVCYLRMTNIKSFQKALKFLDSDFLLTGYDET